MLKVADIQSANAGAACGMPAAARGSSITIMTITTRSRGGDG
ncbi:MAG: hypothetical protein ACXWUN_09600 [Allosphingosinicella sp.]